MSDVTKNVENEEPKTLGQQVREKSLSNVKDLEETIEWINSSDEIETDVHEDSMMHLMLVRDEKKRRLIQAIKENVLGRFHVFGSYTVEDYDQAMCYLSSLLENTGYDV